MNNLNLPSVRPEQKSETSKNIAWDNLTKLSQTETWEEHLQKVSNFRVVSAKPIYPLAICEGFKKRFFPHRLLQ